MQLEQQITQNFTEYSNYVNHERAIAHLFDGQKPVARRVLYTMYKLKLLPTTQTKKSSNIVGSTMLYHPHGDASIYGTLVRMAQDFSNKVPLVIGRGAFGNLDNDPAAMRYTEAKLSDAGFSLVELLNKNLIPMVANFDGTEQEPDFLPAQFPVLLVNGSMGIGVGMAANIPSHNISEVIDAVIALNGNSDLTTQDLLSHIKGPDFNSGCSIVNQSEFAHIYGNGKGSFRLRAKFTFSGNELVISNFPFKVPASKVEEQILNEMNSDIVSTVNTTAKNEELRLTLKKGFDQQEVVRWLCANTSAETTFPMELRCLHPETNVPQIFTLKDYLYLWLKQYQTIIRKDLYQQKIKLGARLNIVEGLERAIKLIDEIIATIKQSENRSAAKQAIVEMGFNEEQANAILDIKLARLTKLDGVELEKEKEELKSQLEELEILLTDGLKFKEYIQNLLFRFKKLDPTRLSPIENSVFPKVVKQKSTKFYITNHQSYIKIHEEVPKGKHIIGDQSNPIYVLHDNFVSPIKNTKETVVSNVHHIINGTEDVIHISKDGYIKRTEVSTLQSSRKAIAAKQDVFTALQADKGYVLLTMQSGKQIQFNLDEVKATGRGARGIVAVKLGNEKLVKAEIISAPKKDVKTKRAEQL